MYDWVGFRYEILPIVVAWSGVETFPTIHWLITGRSEWYCRFFSACSTGGGEHFTFLTVVVISAGSLVLCLFCCAARRASPRFVRKPFLSKELLLRCRENEILTTVPTC